MDKSLPCLGIVSGTEAPELTDDGRALRSRLQSRGYQTRAVRWDDRSVDWGSLEVLLLRSCWGYYRRPATFRDWLETVEDAGCVVLNPPAIVRWNMHKFYLQELTTEGVPVLPTEWVEQGSGATLEAILDERDWSEAVVKPAVGTSSHGVWRFSRPVTHEECERFERANDESDLLVQEFAPEISEGELSLVFFAGEYSHAYRSVPADNEYRAHPEYGTSLEVATPSKDSRSRGREILETAANLRDLDSTDILYARVDGLLRGQEFRLMELECIEPYLALTAHKGALEHFTDSIEASLAGVDGASGGGQYA